MLENGYGEDTITEAFGGVQIIEEDLGYLPLTTPYKVLNVIETFADVPEELTAGITISLGSSSKLVNVLGGEAEFSESFLTPDIYGKRITIAYAPATAEDEAIIEKYGGLFNVPAYLVKLKPGLYVDGEVVAWGNPVAAGATQRYNINIKDIAKSHNDENESNIITAGGMYTVSIDYGTISTDELKKLSENIKELESYISEENIYTESAMGELLDSVSKAYFSQLDMYNSFVAGQNEVIQTRDLSLGIVGFAANGVYSFGKVAELNEGGIFLDICHDVHSVVSLNNNDIDEKEYMLQTGIYASAMEHGVLEQFTGVESVSTIKTLNYAVANNIPIHTITDKNYKEEIGKLKVESSVLDDIKTAVNKGKIVIIAEETITINQWSGSGYMVLDPDTFACGYMISGGLSGGSMTFGQMLGEYVSYVLTGIVYMVMWELVTTTLLAMMPCGWVFALQLAINFAQVLMIMSAVTEMIALVVKYMQTGDVYYLQELLVQIASFATLSIVANLAADKLSLLKEKVVEEIDNAGLRGVCFVAGTLIMTATGLMPIEDVKQGDMVKSFNPGTLEVSAKEVEATFIKETSKLTHVSVGNEEITTTPNHPFYVIDRGFVEAGKLRAGDILCTVNGKKVIVEWVQHEYLESPVNVYNFSVADNHTYFVGENSVGVHNVCTTNTNLQNINDFIKGEKHFKDVIGDYANLYTDLVKSNKQWEWNQFPGVELLGNTEKATIRQYAIDNGLLPKVEITKVKGLRYGEADFKGANLVVEEVYLPQEYWKLSDKAQFDYCNAKIGGARDGYTWHHSLEPGIMQLVETGIHNMYTHNGGRTTGMWAEGKR